MVKLKVTTIGSSAGVVLPQGGSDTPQVDKGDTLSASDVAAIAVMPAMAAGDMSESALASRFRAEIVALPG